MDPDQKDTGRDSCCWPTTHNRRAATQLNELQLRWFDQCQKASTPAWTDLDAAATSTTGTGHYNADHQLFVTAPRRDYYFGGGRAAAGSR